MHVVRLLCDMCRSKAPTAFTGYSFHIAEAALVFANEVLVCFLFPIHAGLHRIYHLFTTVIHNGVCFWRHMLPLRLHARSEIWQSAALRPLLNKFGI